MLPVILSTLLSNFATSDPNLCDLLHADASGAPYLDSTGQGLARYCAWTGPEAPVLDANLCCDIDVDGAACTAADHTGRCRSGTRFYCEYGEATAAGVICYQPFPSMCDAGLCVAPPDVPPPGLAVEGVVCCAGGVCVPTDGEDGWDCRGEFLACPYGILNADGTVECYT
ncbi:hypothetical protein ENSA5_30250 [Enhygromyxa salina]|uniref:Uncharacterized protein n=1 Tax=Enhygromyxa salina TaxID=215803 RepID=A0A2S9XZK2_9BACT|nr:hypothetical protein ENSA5_30250 [Enhygromyxa salina]